MPVLSFRAKLVLAMMLVVAGVSIVTLFVTQQRVQANYERMFRRQFDWQINYFTSLQDARLSAVKEQCLKLSSSVRLIAALEARPIDANVLYDTTVDEQKRVLLVSMFQEVRMAGIAGSRRVQANLFRFLDADGKAIQPPEKDHARFGMVGPKWRLEEKLTHIRGALSNPEQQQVGYLALTVITNHTNGPRAKARRVEAAEQLDNTNAPALQEIIVTKMIDTAENDQVVGALVIGFPLPDLIPKPKTENSVTSTNQFEAIQAGILLEDHLYANPSIISEATAVAVAAKVNERIRALQKFKDDFAGDVQNAHYRIFYEKLNQSTAFPPSRISAMAWSRSC